MTIEEYNQKLKQSRIALLGLGVSNIPLLDYLYALGCEVVIFNTKALEDNLIKKIEDYNYKYHIGEDALEYLHNFDIVFRSPSILPTRKEISEAISEGAIVTSEIKELIRLAPCRVIGITGSDGKTTTTTLINEILKSNGYKTYVGGNIGIPLFTELKNMKKDDIIILELSSFQLMDMDVSPDISIVTNITENHLDIHKDYNEYIEAKKNIFKYQDKSGILVVNADNIVTNKFVGNGITRYFSRSKRTTYFSNDFENVYYKDEKILNINDIKLKGVHNLENIATVLTAIIDLIDLDKALKVIKNFNGVEHRLEFVREINGVKWYNDSVSSSPTRTIAGVYSYSEDIVLIAGGYDKNLDYTVIAKPILDKVTKLILIGDTKEKIYNAVITLNKEINKKIDIYKVNTLPEVVDIAKKVATKDEVVLFSPASASFDMFKNFANRGNQFKKLVNEIKS